MICPAFYGGAYILTFVFIYVIMILKKEVYSAIKNKAIRKKAGFV